MRMAMIGLGKMGGNMVRRLRRGNVEVVGFDRAAEVVAQLAKEDGMIAASSVEDAVSKLSSPRIVWLMLPSGDPTEQQIRALAPSLSKGDIIVENVEDATTKTIQFEAFVGREYFLAVTPARQTRINVKYQLPLKISTERMQGSIQQK